MLIVLFKPGLIWSSAVKDLKSSKKMMRLLQGDVGCGKTIVAFITAACVIKNNYQVAIMVPTEILAMQQHYRQWK